MIHLRAFRPVLPTVEAQPVAAVVKQVAPSAIEKSAIEKSAGRKSERPMARAAVDASMHGVNAGFGAATARTNERLAAHYPSLAFALRDPEAFMAQMRGRFELQKKKTPETPHRFDISDFGMPLVKELRSAIANKITAVEGLKPSEQKTLALAHLRELQGELDTQIRSGKLDYQTLQELGYFVSRALGHFDVRTLNLRDRLALEVDRGMQGHKHESIKEELARYRERRFDVFQARSNVGAFDKVQDSFEAAFFDKNELHFFYIPSTIELDRDIFMRLAMHPIFLGGVAEKPIPADGFVRPGYDFWLHDVRHASLIWSEFQHYAKANDLSPAQQTQLRGQYDVWMEELDAAIAKLPARQAEAVTFFKFNYCHERGILPLPSSFTDKAPRLFSSLREPLFMTNLNFRVLKLTDQAPKFTSFLGSESTFREAYLFLQRFFADKLPAEEAIAGKKVHNPSLPSNYKR
jgi:hypothetical protein